MPTPVLLPHGKTIDLDAVAVIRSVSANESTRFNERMATMPGGNGLVSDRRWTVALEVRGEKGIQTRYTADVTVAEQLNEKNLDALKTALKSVTGKDVALNVKVDPSIIGGLVVKLGSRMVDSSLRTKLNSIKHAMKEAG